MGFWSELQKGFAETRAGHCEEDACKGPGEPPPEEFPHSPPDAHDRRECPDCAKRAAEIADLRRNLAESTSVVAELAAEVDRLTAALKEQGRGGPKNAKGGDEKYRKLKTAIAKHLHPDTAGANKAVAAALERIFKEVRAAIESIERS